MLNQLLKPILEALPENNRLERMWLFAKIDFRKRYYDSILGLFWALINPLFRLLVYYTVFTVLFGRAEKYYALYLFIGLLCWRFFSEGTNKGLKVFKSKRYLLESIQFEKKDLFLSSTFSVLFGFLFNLLAYSLMSLLMEKGFGVNALFFPVFILNLYIFIYGVALLLGTISIYFKDITHLWDMILLAGFWSVPIFWDQQLILKGEVWFLLYLNPIAGIVINMRNVLIYDQLPDFFILIYDFSFALIFMLIATCIFNKHAHKAIEKL